MKAKAYIETTVISYLAAQASRHLIVAGHQKSTRKWWRERRRSFALFCSQLVVQEASAGDSKAAARRLRLLRVPVLVATEAIGELARQLTRSGGIPREAPEDAVHVAFAVIHGMDYLVTWNCRHIANAQIRNNLSATCSMAGYQLPVICTPEELLGE